MPIFTHVRDKRLNVYANDYEIAAGDRAVERINRLLEAHGQRVTKAQLSREFLAELWQRFLESSDEEILRLFISNRGRNSKFIDLTRN